MLTICRLHTAHWCAPLVLFVRFCCLPCDGWQVTATTLCAMLMAAKVLARYKVGFGKPARVRLRLATHLAVWHSITTTWRNRWRRLWWSEWGWGVAGVAAAAEEEEEKE